MLFAFDSTLHRYTMISDIDTYPILPSITSEATRYLFLLSFIVVTSAQALVIGTPLAKWFVTNLELWLNLPNQSVPSDNPDKPSSKELDDEHSATPEARYFRTTVQPGGRVEVASPELEVGRTADVVVHPIKCRTVRE